MPANDTDQGWLDEIIARHLNVNIDQLAKGREHLVSARSRELLITLSSNVVLDVLMELSGSTDEEASISQGATVPAQTDQLKELLRRVLETSPNCFRSGCEQAAVYRMPTAVLGDTILVCKEHRTSDGNEFGEKTVELPWAALHRDIRRVLDTQ